VNPATAPQEFHYRARFASRALAPGAHASRVAGSGLDVAGVVPLARARDARRLDLRTCLRDPLGGWWARELHQRSSVDVVLMVDTSASVAAGAADRGRRVVEFAQAVQRSVARTGDAFGLVTFDAAAASSGRPGRSRAAAWAAIEQLGASAFAGRSADGVVPATALLPRAPTLVFLVSDFCWPPDLLDEALGRLQRHDVVPVWIDEPDAVERLPRFGLLPLRDAESGRQRLVWLRPSLHKRWAEQQRAHRDAVLACLARHERAALHLRAPFDADAVTDHFASRR
jgi:hypothetical protein